MELKDAIGAALKQLREGLHVAQEELPGSQSYLSGLERGRRMPTLEKIDELATAMGVSPLTVITLAYAILRDQTPRELYVEVSRDLKRAGFTTRT